MKKIVTILLVIVSIMFVENGLAQSGDDKTATSYLRYSWNRVATQMPEEWYASPDAKKVAETVLFCQQDIGGWAKNKPYHHELTDAERAEVIKAKPGVGATIDNGATTTEMKFLAKMYANHKDERYRKAFLKALGYIFEAQYKNGGWPQFYPFREGKTVAYASHITYNDNAMVNVMQMLDDIAANKPLYAALQIDDQTKQKAKKAFDNGVDCILKTQIKVDGQPTVWCAQHDEFTLAPANARAYELASFSGAESVGITLLLMELDHPSKEVVDAVKGAVTWFEDHKIEDIKIQSVTNAEGKRDRVVVEDKNAPPLWARFYDLDTEQPYFADRDGIKRKTFAELGHERRNGYAWYTNAPQKVLDQYPAWKKKWNIN